MLSIIHTENKSATEVEPMLEFPLKILDAVRGSFVVYIKKFLELQAAKLRT